MSFERVMPDTGYASDSDSPISGGLNWLKSSLLTSVVLWGVWSGPATAATFINEVLLNPPGNDNGFEFFELSGTAAASLSGLTLVVIDGDGTAAGSIDATLSLSGFSLGSNGLFLWRDAATVLNPVPDPSTTVNVANFTPDLENGSTTFALVSGFTGRTGLDLDANNDGIFDSSLPWTSVLDAVGILENDSGTNRGYAAALGGVQFPVLSTTTSSTYTPDAFFRYGDTWVATDISGSVGGPYTLNPTANSLPNGAAAGLDATVTLTPGSINPTPVPEPSTVAGTLTALAALGALKRRKQKQSELESQTQE